jgi:low affinity iron permease
MSAPALSQCAASPSEALHAKSAANLFDGRRHLDLAARRVRCCLCLRSPAGDLRSGVLQFPRAIALITLCMTLFIQRSEHRDTQAIQAKLDEQIRTRGSAQQNLTRLDEQEPEQIEAYRAAARAHD